MTVALEVLGVVLLLIGFIGCVVPILPGPLLGYCGLLSLFWTDTPPSTSLLVAMGAAVAVVTVADYVVPAIGARKFDCSRWGTFGCFVGTFVGVFFFPIGLLAGPFLGALVGEMIAGKNMRLAVRSGIGALLGFLSGVVLKLFCCAAMTVVFVKIVTTQ